MINAQRKEQFLELMEKSGWDVLVIYGHSWRKDFFRSLVNFNFFGPHAAVALSRSGELSILVSHPWDQEILAWSVDARIRCTPEFGIGLRGIVSEFNSAKIAIAGMEFMEARFVDSHAI